MHHGVHGNVHDAGISDANYFDLKNLCNEELQKVADAVCAIVENHNPRVLNFSNRRFTVNYICGKSISAPLWLKDYRGHDLEAAFRDAFRAHISNGFVLTKNQCEDLVEMISERLPDFIPVELVETFKELQSC